MAEVNPKAYPLADAQLTITILDIVQQAAVRLSPNAHHRSDSPDFALKSNATAEKKTTNPLTTPRLLPTTTHRTTSS